MAGSSEAELVLVRRRDLERLTTEVMQMREFLPQIVNPELVESVQRLEEAEAALEGMDLDCDHFRARLEAAQGECLRSREENLSLLLQLSAAREEAAQGAEFCHNMGAVLCTLLWGVSNREEAVKSILGMDQSAELFSLASQILTSYVTSVPAPEEPKADAPETRMVLGLAGTVTNVAAVSQGRGFLVSSCRDLMENWIQILGKIQLGTCSYLRVLLLMSLYNVSIHAEGLVWLSQRPGLVCELRRLLSDPDAEVCLHALRLLQSVTLDAEVARALRGDLRECVPEITALMRSAGVELKRTARELLEEIGELQSEG
ncbi:heat shock factor 2-binding protein [Gastrophryne carolinensis]